MKINKLFEWEPRSLNRRVPAFWSLIETTPPGVASLHPLPQQPQQLDREQQASLSLEAHPVAPTSLSEVASSHPLPQQPQQLDREQQASLSLEAHPVAPTLYRVQCHKCHRVLNGKHADGNLQRHRNSCIKGVVHRCFQCSKTYKRKDALRNHEKKCRPSRK
jgi:hypothetical protein